MNYKVRFEGESPAVTLAIKAMFDFNSIIPAPSDFGINSMIPISEDYFYYLLSKRGLVSKEQGERAIRRFEAQTANIGEVLIFAYKVFAEKMVENLDKYDAPTVDVWRERNWGCSMQPECFRSKHNEVSVRGADVPKPILSALCQQYGVRAKITKT